MILYISDTYSDTAGGIMALGCFLLVVLMYSFRGSFIFTISRVSILWFCCCTVFIFDEMSGFLNSIILLLVRITP